MTADSMYIADRIAIQDVLVRYCRGLDRHDLGLALSAFTADATITFYEGKTGFAHEVVPALVAGLEGCEAAQRTISTNTVSISGEEAGSEAYFVAYYVMSRPPLDKQFITFGGRYVDRLRKVAGEWRIISRVALHDWDHVAPLSIDYPERQKWMNGRHRGSPSTNDLSYTVV
jgi:hypothetical protein